MSEPPDQLHFRFYQLSTHFLFRKWNILFLQVAKYPHVEDYRQAVRELDEKEYLSMWLVMCEIRNRYCTLHDIVTKNLEKIKKPRSTNSESLYWREWSARASRPLYFSLKSRHFLFCHLLTDVRQWEGGEIRNKLQVFIRNSMSVSPLEGVNGLFFYFVFFEFFCSLIWPILFFFYFFFIL